MKINSPLLMFFAFMFLTGEVMCIIKAFRCNWSPIGKAEALYTASAMTGLGFVVGWVTIEDN